MCVWECTGYSRWITFDAIVSTDCRVCSAINLHTWGTTSRMGDNITHGGQHHACMGGHHAWGTTSCMGDNIMHGGTSRMGDNIMHGGHITHGGTSRMGGHHAWGDNITHAWGDNIMHGGTSRMHGGHHAWGTTSCMRDIMHGGTHHITNLCNDNIRVLVLVCQLVPRGGKALTVSTPTHTVWWLCTVQENDVLTKVHKT